MSSEWQTLTIGQLGRVVTGKTPKTSDPENFGNQIPFVTPTDMDGCKVMATTARYLSEQGASTVKSSIIPAGSVMVSCIGSDMGKSVIAKHRCVTNQQINSVVVDTQFSSEFVYYNLSMRKAELQHLASGGSTMPILNKGMFSEVTIDLPPLAEQLQIVSTLSALDDRITLLRETNATLEAIAQALFKSWFVDFDPVRAKQEGRAPEGTDEATARLFPDSFEESELGLVPKGWRVSRIDEFMELAYGKALKATDRIAGEIPVYGSGGVTGFHNESLVMGPSIIIGRKGTVGSLYWEDQPFFAIDTVFYVRAVSPMTYCFYLLQTLGLTEMNTDAAVPGLNRGNVYRLTVPFPGAEILGAFDDIVGVIRKRIFNNSQQAQTLATLRDTLLPRLISGQLRLPEALAEMD